ncbi:MAG: hypothetical protein BMS9Abin22_151 [Gammaproteobacteria bacterium]|nr:MAG: hypothetical protein BMS9Abin22_151 [Gammaproteobacteria bacterium]
MKTIKCVYLNGKFLSPDQASVSVFDRGFVFGEGIYEVIPVFGGRPFRLAPHLTRLESSLAAVRIHNPHNASEWDAIFARLIKENDVQGRTSVPYRDVPMPRAQDAQERPAGGTTPGMEEVEPRPEQRSRMPGAAEVQDARVPQAGERADTGDQSIYLQITRGAAPRDHAFPTHTTPTVFAYAQPLNPPDPETLASGVSAITTPDIRWQRCDIKATALLANVLLRQQAVDQGVVEAILLRDGSMTEGAASNIFIVSGGRLVTPPKGPYILPGITRDLVLELARANQVPCAEEPVSEAHLFSAEEVWLTSSTKEILPITRINDKPVGRGKPGPVYARLRALYKDYKLAFCQGKVA